MYRYFALDPTLATSYAPFATPYLRPLLEGSPLAGGAQVVAVGAAFLGRPRGLALALLDRENRVARLHDLIIAPAYRGAGVGTALLAAL
jgi:GNAT superfamily N-acetyltransferase